MGIYLPNMEMPTKGYRLILVHADGIVQTTDGETTAVPVPPHGRLIDADALMKQIEHDTPLSDVFEKTMRRYLHNAPTIIPAEPFNNLSKPCKDDADFPICTKASPASLGIYKKAEEGET